MRRVWLTLGEQAFLADVADSPEERARGLEPYAFLLDSHALVLPCPTGTGAIHMGAVRFPIDVVFVKGGAVVGIVHAIPPGSRDVFSAPADMVIELAGGAAERHGLALGQPARLGDAGISVC